MQILKKFSFKLFTGSVLVLLACISIVAISTEKIASMIIGKDNLSYDFLYSTSDNIDQFFLLFAVIAFTLSICSFFGLFVKPEVFKSWIKYLLWWIIPMIIAYGISTQPGDGFIPNPFAPLAPLTLGLFILSTPIYLYFKSKKMK